MYKFKDGCVYFLRISPCILHAGLIKFILKCYAIVLHFLSFSLFFHFFFYFINTQNCPLRNVSFGYTLYRTVDRNFANVILNIVKQKGII